jgi:hypothetical protein
MALLRPMLCNLGGEHFRALSRERVSHYVPVLERGLFPLRDGGLFVRFGFLNLAPAPMPSRLIFGLAMSELRLDLALIPRLLHVPISRRAVHNLRRGCAARLDRNMRGRTFLLDCLSPQIHEPFKSNIVGATLEIWVHPLFYAMP